MIRKGKAMTEKETCSGKAADLRRRAEEIAREKAAQSPEDLEVLSPEETRQTLHDLRVHQIELMMQNEELRRAQAELDAARARYFDLYDLAPVGYVTLSEQGLILEANLTAATLLGVARSDLVKRPITRFILREDHDIYYLHRKQLFATGAPQVCELRLRRVDDSHFWARIDATSAQEVKGLPVCRLVMTDITGRKKREDEDALRASERRFRETLENVQLIALELDTEGRVVFCNDFLLHLTGWPQEEIVGQDWFSRFLPENERESVRAVHKKNLRTGTSFTHYENPIQTRNGELRHIRWNNTAVRGADGRVTSIIGLGEDITERKLAEEQIKRSLKEKEVLLKEIHHRTKNNMQVIYSLLSLQAKGIADPAIRVNFEEARNRVSTMALIHDKLYRSADLAHIDFKKYLQSLVAGIVDAYKRRDVVYSVDMESIPLDVNVGIPCGLIVNELVSNSLKYAFPDGKTGTIKVGINRKSESNHVLFVADDGIGFPAEVDFRNTWSLGLQLVNTLAEQLHGKIELSREKGTRFSITFPATSNSAGEQNG